MNSSSSAVPGSLPLYKATHWSATSIPFNSPNLQVRHAHAFGESTHNVSLQRCCSMHDQGHKPHLRGVSIMPSDVHVTVDAVMAFCNTVRILR